ncbi:MAG: hypothetical protein LJF30_13210 [Acidobacteria bacterium]|jgi:hypothetical protein|nr:hypothetical protein [Acidobacteriota bacterium]
MTAADHLRGWLSNPVLVEWEEPVAWSDHATQRSYEAYCELARVLAFRSAPLAVLLLGLGFWWIGRIPGGAGPVSLSRQLLIAVPLLAVLVLPHLARGFLKPRPGRRRRIRLCERGPQVVGDGGAAKTSRWAEFDAFDFARWRDVPLLKLRLRGSWISRRLAARRVVGFGVDFPEAEERLRPLLRQRGLHEKPLEDPFRQGRYHSSR